MMASLLVKHCFRVDVSIFSTKLKLTTMSTQDLPKLLATLSLMEDEDEVTVKTDNKEEEEVSTDKKEEVSTDKKEEVSTDKKKEEVVVVVEDSGREVISFIIPLFFFFISMVVLSMYLIFLKCTSSGFGRRRRQLCGPLLRGCGRGRRRRRFWGAG